MTGGTGKEGVIGYRSGETGGGETPCSRRSGEWSWLKAWGIYVHGLEHSITNGDERGSK